MIKLRPKSQAASKLSTHADQKIEREFANVYRALARVDMGPFSWCYDKENRRLVLQVMPDGSGEPKAVWQIDEDGEIKPLLVTYGTGTPEAY